MVRLIDQGKPQSVVEVGQEHDNFAINEVLAYMLHSFFPVVFSTEHYQVLEEQGPLHESLLNLLDIINLKCKYQNTNFNFL